MNLVFSRVKTERGVPFDRKSWGWGLFIKEEKTVMGVLFQMGGSIPLTDYDMWLFAIFLKGVNSKIEHETMTCINAESIEKYNLNNVNVTLKPMITTISVSKYQNIELT